VAEYFHDYRQTARRPDELVVDVRIPIRPDADTAHRHAFSYKVGKRGTDDISIVAACFRVDVDRAGRIRHARLAYGGVAAVPIRARAVEDALVGEPWNEATARTAGRALRDAFTPLDDHRGSAAYRRALAGNLFEKFWHEHRGAS
jgi:xanthine dehydrogenase iron-sulfur cluster and FAD-binding subunit A